MYNRICTGLEVGTNFIMYKTRSDSSEESIEEFHCEFQEEFSECVKTRQTPVIFCPNDCFQIRSVAGITCMEFRKSHYSKIVIINDEGGYVTRNDNGYESDDPQEEWVEYIEFLERARTSIKIVCIAVEPVDYT